MVDGGSSSQRKRDDVIFRPQLPIYPIPICALTSESKVMSEEIILSTAAYHDQLCSAISNLNYVQEALSQQEACVADVESRYRECEKKLQALSAETRKARKVHEGWRDSSTIRLAHKLAGKKEKYAAKGSREER